MQEGASASSRRSIWRYYALHLSRAGFAFLIAFLLTQFSFDALEAMFFDARMRLRPHPAPTGQIETVTINTGTISALGRIPNAVDHTKVLAALRDAGARVIISVVNPTELVGSDEETAAFAALASSLPNHYVAVDDVPLRGEKDALKLSAPFEKLKVAGAPVTADKNIFARDDVTRRMMLSYQGLPTLHSVLANLARTEPKPIRGTFEYLGSDQAYVQYSPTGTYRPTPFHDVLRAPAGKFRDKIVIVGRDIQTTSQDYVRTPYSRDIVAMTIVEYHANVIDTLIRNDAPVRTPAWLDRVVTGLISYLTVIVVLTVTPTSGLLILGSTILGYSALAFLLFWLGGVWIDVAHPFLAIFICYYFFIPYRLIIENRRSWEYFEKNKLLTQIEELKTNFLSMMSHDLKTPIARIQGMLEVIRSDTHGLSERQQEAMRSLKGSSDELLDFISGILNLGRIESKALQLQLHSHDLNKLAREAVEKLEYQARSKNITLKQELEPLFSIKVDGDLIRQVLSNLIENAIKYSPEGSSVLVSTEEHDGWICAQVADQGPGIPDSELPNIFMKFYRSRNAKASTIKGSGLGLYLAKYFVELHKGRIHVDSRLGQGSTFTVELPSS